MENGFERGLIYLELAACTGVGYHLDPTRKEK